MKAYIGRSVFPEFQSPWKIHYHQSIYTAGSCFAQELANRLDTYKIKNTRHPFGIVFNPLSFAAQIDKLTEGYIYQNEDLIEKDGLMHSLDHHGSYSASNCSKMLDEINKQMQTARMSMTQSDFMIVTLGSAHYYLHKDKNQIVANCHKIPQTEFVKERADTDSIIQKLSEAISKIKKLNATINIILTVSPVRYLRDGFEENSRSKASLLLSCEQLCHQIENVAYFPAYEIFMDDLRDYRYVKEDLIHPTEKAVDYIWSYFTEAYFDEATLEFKKRMDVYNNLLNHRILNMDSANFTKHQSKLEEIRLSLEKDYPEIFNSIPHE